MVSWRLTASLSKGVPRASARRYASDSRRLFGRKTPVVGEADLNPDVRVIGALSLLPVVLLRDGYRTFNRRREATTLRLQRCQCIFCSFFIREIGQLHPYIR